MQQQRVTSTANELQAALSECDPAHADEARSQFLLDLDSQEPSLATQVQNSTNTLRSTLQDLYSNPANANGVADLSVHYEAIDALCSWADRRETHAKSLLATEDPEKLASMRQEVAELRARQLLGERLDEFQAWQNGIRVACILDQVHTALATNKITTKQRELASGALTATLQKSLNEELARLRCTHLPIDINMHVTRAETSVGLRLLSSQATGLAGILSEGEHRAVALAFFFAELDVMDDCGGVILDDPVSSLDDERSGYIADRLIKEAGRRQVVVFTHDLPFLTDLQAKAKSETVHVLAQGVWRLGQEVGRVDGEPPFKVMNLKQRIGVLKQRVEQWNAQPEPSNFDEAWGRVTSFYEDLRRTWERAVEERLFRGVVQRFQRAVKTLKLEEVLITEELKQQVKTGMDRASTYMHDEPVGNSVPLPGRGQLESDLKLLVQFEERTRKSS